MGGPTIGFSRLRQEVFVPAARVISRAARGWRLATALVLVAVAVAAAQVWRAERQTAPPRNEGAWLPTRPGGRRGLIAPPPPGKAPGAGGGGLPPRPPAAGGGGGAGG